MTDAEKLNQVEQALKLIAEQEAWLSYDGCTVSLDLGLETIWFEVNDMSYVDRLLKVTELMRERLGLVEEVETEKEVTF